MADGVRLFFLRHGPADRDQFDGDDDDLRPLVERGRQRMRAIAEVIARLDQKIDTVVTSPLVRTAETAEIVANRLGLQERMITDERLGLDFDVQALASILAGLKNDRRRILLVGHEPGFSEVIGELTGGGGARPGRPHAGAAPARSTGLAPAAARADHSGLTSSHRRASVRLKPRAAITANSRGRRRAAISCSTGSTS